MSDVPKYREFSVPDESPEKRRDLHELFPGYFRPAEARKIELFRSQPQSPQQGVVISVFCEDEDPEFVCFLDLELARWLLAGLEKQLQELDASND